MNISDLDQRLVRSLHDAEYTDEEIWAMTPERRFECYCTWHGLINWSNTLREIHLACYGPGAKIVVPPPKVETPPVSPLIDKYPNIRFCAAEIGYDGGAINRLNPLASYLLALDPVFCSTDEEDLRRLEEWLGTLTVDERQTVATGEMREADKFCERRGCPRGGPDNVFLTDILDDIAGEGAP